MINASELRIGNVAKIPNGEEFSIVTGITNDWKIWFVPHPQHEECAWNTEEVKPIPLSPKLLERLGFETEFYGGQGNVGYYAKKDLTPNGPFRKYFKIDSYDGHEYLFMDGKFPVGISVKNAHELQNLYFAITRKELTLK